MSPGTHEQTVNDALGEVLRGLRRADSWTVHSEATGGVLIGGGRPDVLVLEASGWPVVIEAELANHASAEADAIARLGRKPSGSAHEIETAIALVYPPAFQHMQDEPLRAAIRETDALEYALYTQTDGAAERLPHAGWLRGSVRDLAMLVQRAATPAARVQALADELERGVEDAAQASAEHHHYGGDRGRALAAVLEQTDDPGGQTRRMAMTVIVNALVFHEALAQADFQVGPEGEERPVRTVEAFRTDGIFDREALLAEWDEILERNYWPIFGSAKALLDPSRDHALPTESAQVLLAPLWRTAQRLVAGGVTRSHDLTGVVFQRLIADRKFLATYYTRPAAAALLAGLALPAARPPGGAEWGDEDTLASLQIGDFACGTGTLLSAAYSRLSLLHELHGGDPAALHGPMMKHGLVGLDVLNIAVHLTAAMLAGSQPATPFDGECLLTMPYGRARGGQVRIGSLDLLAPQVQARLIGQAAATTAGGRRPADVQDLVTRIGHGQFDLVIMNPPFTRPGNTAGRRKGTSNPAFAAFDTSRSTQQRMQAALKRARGTESIGTGNAGLASDFADLAHRKVRVGGATAMVLPLSAISGESWRGIRAQWRAYYRDMVVVTIAGADEDASSFSADTGMAECLIVADRDAATSEKTDRRSVFAVLSRQSTSAIRSDLIASAIRRAIDDGEVRRLEAGPVGGTPILLGDEHCGFLLDCPVEGDGAWPLVGIADMSLAQVAYRLQRGRLLLPQQVDGPPMHTPIAQIGGFSPHPAVHHRDITETSQAGYARGPFERLQPPLNLVPTYPMLWAHDAKQERRLVVEPDSEGQIKAVEPALQPDVNEKAARVWATATRAHYSTDLRFNSQSLIVAMTERPCIGGRAWPSVILENSDHEYAFALWCNSTLGLLLHWWTANKTQSGRGTTTVTGIPRIPALDVRALSEAQHRAARDAFEALRTRQFLPFDQIDEDEARAELDRALLVDVLGLPASLCEPDGPLALLRRKLAAEPQIHGGKRTRVVFSGGGETTERRKDRGSPRNGVRRPCGQRSR